MSADIIAANAIEEPCFVHHKQGLGVRAAEDEVFAASMKLVVEVLKGVQAGSVHGQNFAHSQDENLRFLTRSLECGFQLVGNAEEESAEDAENEHAVGNGLADEGVVGAFGFGGLVYCCDLSRFRDSFNEKDGGEYHADFDGNRKINQDSERKGGQEY